MRLKISAQGCGVIFIAAAGHCISHAKHCMQSFSRAGSDFRSERGCPGESAQSYNETGQTSMQTPSPTQLSQSTALVVPWIPSLWGFNWSPDFVTVMFTDNLSFSLKIRVYWQKIHHNNVRNPIILGFLPEVLHKAFLGSQHIIVWFQ